jgi:flagellin
MPLGINYNPDSARGTYGLNRSYQSLLKTMEKLASGLRINRASDDPAGLVISEQMRSQIASLNQEIENTSLSIRKYNTADATVGQLHTVLQGVRSMAVGAANEGFNDQAAQDAYQAAADRAVENYNRIIETAGFNNANLLDGSEGSLVDLPQLGRIDLSDSQHAQQSLEQIDQALSRLDQAQVEIGSTQKYELEAKRSNLEVTVQNLTAAESEIRDTDYPMAVVEMIKSEIQVKAAIALLAHSQVNHRAVLSLLGD